MRSSQSHRLWAQASSASDDAAEDVDSESRITRASQAAVSLHVGSSSNHTASHASVFTGGIFLVFIFTPGTGSFVARLRGGELMALRL